MVATYLKSVVGSKFTDKFMKETNSSLLPLDSPGLEEIVQHFQKTYKPEKRKLLESNGAIKAKKAKKNESSSDSSEDSDAKEEKPSAQTVIKKDKKSADDDSRAVSRIYRG